MVTANDIFEQLIKDPEYIGREEEARGEAEYRARQHHNNIRALSLANEAPSAIKQLSEFFLKDWTYEELYEGSASNQANHEIEINKIIAINSADNLSPKAQSFLETLAKNNVPPETMVTLSKIANSKEDDGWINGVMHQITTNSDVAGEFGITKSIQKQLQKKNAYIFFKFQNYMFFSKINFFPNPLRRIKLITKC